jgi:ArsR family transcriptional regulator, lead/cadmium/zinc/bismuth-responsive transcriptional repressor
MNDSNCIRIAADENQLAQCKKDLASAEREIRTLSGILSLAGNEVRMKILYLLGREGKMCPCDLSDVLDMSMPAISQHLRKLKDKDLILYKKVGQTIFYSLNEEHSELLDLLFYQLEITTQLA